MFPDEVLSHLEFIRFAGKVTCSALPVVRYTTEERLNEIIDLHESHGVFIANPHVYTLEDGSRQTSAWMPTRSASSMMSIPMACSIRARCAALNPRFEPKI